MHRGLRVSGQDGIPCERLLATCAHVHVADIQCIVSHRLVTAALVEDLNVLSAILFRVLHLGNVNGNLLQQLELYTSLVAFYCFVILKELACLLLEAGLCLVGSGEFLVCECQVAVMLVNKVRDFVNA